MCMHAYAMATFALAVQVCVCTHTNRSDRMILKIISMALQVLMFYQLMGNGAWPCRYHLKL